MAITSMKALKMYFESDGGRQLLIEELKALSATERRELAELAAKELGEELEPTPKK